MDNARPPPLVFSTEDLPVRERFDAWRETFARSLARVDVTTPDPGRFRARATVHILDHLHLIDLDLGAMSLLRTRELLSDGDDGFSLVISTAGGFEARDCDGEVTAVRRGRAVLVPHYRQGGTRAGRGTRNLSVVIPRSLLGQVVRDPDAAAARTTLASGTALDLLIGYIRHVGALAAGLPEDILPLVEGHILDLLARVYDPAGDWSRASPNGGVRAAQLKRILDMIGQRFADPSITAEAAAARLGISPRYLHLLLAETGTTFTEHVREHRLQAARRMLASPRLADRRILDIALAVGFSDLSYFNRTFRRRFGDSPGAFRSGS